MDGRAQGTTLRLPRGYPEATPRLPRGYPEATLGCERGEWVALAGNKGRFAQPTIRFPIFGINDSMLVVVWGLGVSLFSLHENKWRSWRRAAPSKPKAKTRNNDSMLVVVWG
jgi:hypothetical protein